MNWNAIVRTDLRLYPSASPGGRAPPGPTSSVDAKSKVRVALGPSYNVENEKKPLKEIKVSYIITLFLMILKIISYYK